MSTDTPLWKRDIEVELYASEDATEKTGVLLFRQPTLKEAIEAQELNDQGDKMSATALAEARLKLLTPLFKGEDPSFFSSAAALGVAGKVWEDVFFRTGWIMGAGADRLRRLEARQESELWDTDGGGGTARGDGPEVPRLHDDMRGEGLPAGVSGTDVQGMPEAGESGNRDGGDPATQGSD